MKKYSRGELAKEILKGLALGGFIVVCFALPGFAQVASLFKANSAADRSRLKQSLKHLSKKRYVRIYEKTGKEVIEITEAGKRRVLEYQIDDIKIERKKRWDGLWRVVMFDISESKKRARNALNLKMKEMGMITLQKSTFVSPYPCRDEIDFIGEHYNVRKDIIYMEVANIDRDKLLRSIFKV